MSLVKKKEEKDHLILDAAKKEFLDKGFQVATMHEIALQSGVSKATLYKYYPNKTKLFLGVIGRLFDHVDVQVNYDYQPHLSFQEKIQYIINKKIELLTSECFLQLTKLAVEVSLQNFEINQLLLPQLNQNRRRLAKLIDRYVELGRIQINQDSFELSLIFHQMASGFVTWPILLHTMSSDSPQLQWKKDFMLESFLSRFKILH